MRGSQLLTHLLPWFGWRNKGEIRNELKLREVMWMKKKWFRKSKSKVVAAAQRHHCWSFPVGWTRSTPAVPSAALRGVLVLRHASHVCKLSIATLNARGIIGRSIKNNANNVPPSYAMRRCSRTRRRRRTVPFASCQCRIEWYAVSHFHPRLYCQYRFMTLQLQMRHWKIRLRKIIIHAAEKAFVEGVNTPSARLETLASVHSAIPTEVAKQRKSVLKKWWGGWRQMMLVRFFNLVVVITMD